jgi:hypothetical protein
MEFTRSDAAESEKNPKTKEQLIQELRQREKRPLLRRPESSSSQSRPLTRYLPIRGATDDFDLRAHIETSGHQIEACSHVKIDASTCRGFLTKIGAKFKCLHRRWFVFDRKRRSLTYYSDTSERKPRGGVYFQFIQETYPDHQQTRKTSQLKLVFIVKTTERIFRLVAPTPEAMRIWVDVIFTGAEGYDTYVA